MNQVRKPGRRLLLGVAGLAGALLLALLLLAAAALDREPLLAEQEHFSVGDVAHALALARQHDPRRAVPGRPQELAMTERDLQLLVHQAARRLHGLRVGLDLQPGQALLQASWPWQLGPANGWVNLQARLEQRPAGLPALASWQMGRLHLPRSWGVPLLRAIWQRQAALPPLELLPELVQQVQFEETQLQLRYTWQADTTRRLLTALTPPEERERLHAYAERLAELSSRQAGHSVPLPALLGPMFALAQERSLQHDAAAENRAAVLSLALYVTGRPLQKLVPEAQTWPRPRALSVQLAGREDFSQHFLISALLAMEGTSPLTEAIGLTKEVQDAQGGSGFSFTDLAANRAGQRFGELALQQPALLQQRLARGLGESALMPRVDDLPEFLQQPEFEAFYGHVGSPPYQRVLLDIERRLGALPLYR